METVIRKSTRSDRASFISAIFRDDRVGIGGVDGTPHQKAATARTVGGHRQAYVGAGAQPASAATKQSRLVRGAGGCTRRK